MKRLALSVALILCVSTVFCQVKTLKNLGKLPNVTLKNLDGQSFSTANIKNNGKPIIITFWATWCKPCMKEHDAINEVYQDWVDETGVKLYAVSIDNSRSASRVKPTVNGKGWEFEVLSDVNQDFKRAINVNEPPHTFILDGSGNIRWQHVGYMDGDENQYIEVVKQILKEKK
ncbi:MAG: TlpA disulfide reductase family protein [Bacteroidales bacterium]|nr:TlpA disulfide reductase family protein [Bacteroidales bacterium]